jgi:hypothetical protein
MPRARPASRNTLKVTSHCGHSGGVGQLADRAGDAAAFERGAELLLQVTQRLLVIMHPWEMLRAHIAKPLVIRLALVLAHRPDERAMLRDDRIELTLQKGKGTHHYTTSMSYGG